MGELIDLNSTIPVARIDPAIATDTEVKTTIDAHVAAPDPHPGYALESSFFSYGDIPTATPGSAALNFMGGGTTAAERSQNGAFIAFHRPGIAANYFGLSIFNDLRLGGWSNSGSSWRVWHENYGVPVWQTPSDSKLKKRIRPIPSALSLILAAKPISFEYSPTLIGKWSESDYHRKKVHYGFAAEEFPITDLVSVKDNGFLGLDYLEIIPFLVRALQELHLEVTELKAKQISASSINS
ncbi:tail fiber domain-containing protein [Microcoleus sp. LAD1_D5]|uniref:tail fiber domain-containing protein n=1 Tax=unclassified Microcoleus TaxID=2642155 RepID=UPI002FD0E6FA